MKTITTDEVRAFQKAVSVADWNMNLAQFAELTGNDPTHSYTQEKFRDLARLNKAINAFDAELLATILGGEKEPKGKHA